jgi:RNA polymerase sigma-32 factor
MCSSHYGGQGLSIRAACCSGEAMMNRSDPELSRYISKVQAFPRISREEERELFLKWQKYDDHIAKHHLVNANLRHVVAIASKYSRYGLPLADLISEGNLGIIHALTKFELERGTRFVTYAAYWIRAYILSYIIRAWSLVGAGCAPMRSKLFFRIGRERARLLNLIGDESAANSLLAEHFGVSPEKMSSMVQRLNTRDVSLDTKRFEDGSSTLLDELASPEPNQEQCYVAAQDTRRIRQLVQTSIETLDNRERYVVVHRLMKPNGEELSLAEIGRIWGVSRERARQLEMRAQRKVKRRILEQCSSEGCGSLPFHPAA